jgi:ribose transport system substrate-binding protein
MVDLRVDIAGPDVTAQTQLINQQVASGVDAIIIYPISPTALNAAVRQACDAGIIVYAYDSIISEPCAYNTFIDQYEWGQVTAQWLVDELGGEGNVAAITGVAGTTVDTLRNQGFQDVLAEHPGITVVGSENGMWDQAQGRTAYQRIEAAAPDIDGIWAQAGCYSIIEYVASTGKPVIPCAGEGANGDRLNMLPESEGGRGVPGISASSTVFPGEVAFLNVMRLLQGEEVAPVTLIPVTAVTNEQLVLGTNPADGANVFPSDLVPPDFFAEIWSPLVSQGIQAALTGESDPISEPKLCSEVPDCTETTLDELGYDLGG